MELERHEGLNERNKPALENYATIIYVTLIGSNPILLPIPWAAMPVRVRISPGGQKINPVVAEWSTQMAQNPLSSDALIGSNTFNRTIYKS